MSKVESKKHATFSASGSERWLNCHGSIALSRRAPKQTESRYAKEGTDAHTVLETVMKNPTNPEQAAAALRRKYPNSMVDHALLTYDLILDKMPKGSSLLCETEVRLDFVDEGMFGTVDAAIVEEFGTLWVIDYKYGAGRLVNPENNTQMIYYALGIAHRLHYNFEVVKLAVAQPRVIHKHGFFRDWSIAISDLKKWIDIFKAGVEACKDEFADLTPGRWCYFCPAQDICPAIQDEKLAKAQDLFSEPYVE